MGQVDFAYEAVADAAGFPLAVSIFADSEHVRGQVREDVETAGLTLRECGSLADFLDGDLRVLGEAILLDCPELDGATLAALSRLDTRAAGSGARLIISTSVDALEDVYGCCSQSNPQILVNPRRADWIVVLGQLLAEVPNLRMRELSEDDRLSLLRLSEQVNQIAGKLDQLSDSAQDSSLRSPAHAFRFDEQAGGTLRSPGDKLVSPKRPSLPDPRLVRQIIQQRQMRARFFDGELFADPAWDMLLDLTAARAEHIRVSVTSLCIASGVPPTTALRWIAQMIEADLLERIEDDLDGRRAFLQLTDATSDAMARYFDAIGRSAGSFT